MNNDIFMEQFPLGHDEYRAVLHRNGGGCTCGIGLVPDSVRKEEGLENIVQHHTMGQHTWGFTNEPNAVGDK